MSEGQTRRPIYSHARQFPHLAGKSDKEIRAIVRSAIAKRPGLIRVLLLRNLLIVLAMPLSAIALRRLTSLSGPAVLIAIGAVATLLIVAWNLVWLNRVVYGITEPKRDATPK